MRTDTVMQRSRLKHGGFWIYLALIAGSLVMIYPLLWMLGSSLKPEGEILVNTGLVPTEVTLENYSRGWNAFQVSFTRFFMNSFVVTTLCVIGNVVSCSLTAYAFARLNFRFKKVWFALMMASIMLPFHVTLIPRYIMFKEFGWMDTYYPLFTPKFFAVDAFFVFLNVQFIRGIPRELDAAATVDGANKFQVYWHVIIPLSLPALVTTGVFTFLWDWNDFFSQLIYLSDIQKFPVTLALRQFIDTQGQSSYGSLFAMSVISLVPAFLVFVMAQRYLVEGIATTGFKG